MWSLPVGAVVPIPTLPSTFNSPVTLVLPSTKLIKNQIRLRDHTYVSGNLYVSGSVVTADGTSPDHISGLSGYFGKVGIGTTVIGANTKLVVSGGYAGIGVTPTVPLHIKEGTYQYFRFTNTNSPITSSTSYTPALLIGRNDSVSNLELSYDSQGSEHAFIKRNYPNAKLMFYRQDQQHMMIDKDGKTLIGEGIGAEALFTVSGDASITGELRVAGEGEFATDLYVGDKIRHIGDSNTFLEFSNDLIYLKAGDVNLLELREVGADYVSVGGLASNTADVNFFVNTEVAGQDYAFVVDAGLPAVGINIDPNNAKGSALVVSGDASITGDLNVAQYIRHGGDADTHINFTDDDINFKVGNVNFLDLTQDTVSEMTVNEAGANLDVRIEGDTDANLFFTDASTDMVGIGTANPDAKLQVNGDASITGDLSITRFIKHGGDENTKIDFGSTEIDFFANNVKGISVKTTEVAINDNSADVNFRVESDNSENMIFVDAGNDLVGFGTPSPSPSYTVTVSGGLAADYKSFIIDHPDPAKPDKQLAYASSETPEHNVFVRGKAQSKIIELPDHWPYLVHEDSISVQLTPIGEHQELYVESIKDNKILINNSKENKINCFYLVHAERKDIGKLEIEPDKSVNKDKENGK